jgi:integrase
MANAKFYLKNKNTNNETLILMFFNYNNKVFKYSTKTSIQPRNWNNKTCRVKQQSSHSLELNKQINNIEDSIMNIYHRMITNDRVVNNKILKEQLDISLNREEKEDFFAYMKKYIEQKNELKKTTKRDYLQTYNTLKEFEKNTSYLVSFDSINLDFYNRFKKFIINDLDHSINTFGKRIKTIKSIMNYATEIGINKNLEYQKSAFKVLDEKTKNIYLSIDEINALKELKLSGALANARDVFLLMCYLGLRFSDYLKINQNSISNDYLDITMHKTNESVSIPIHPYALSIIKRYNYILPKITNTKLNKRIKKVCKYAEIDNEITNKGEIKKKYELVTCHTARRSFATNGYLSDVPVRDLMMITGHKKETTFLDYVQVKREVKLSRVLEIYPAKLSRVG